MTTAFWILGLILTLLALALAYFKRVPHGWVQLKTGLVLKFLPPLDHASVTILRDGLEKFIEKKRSGIAKSLPVKDDRYISIPTRHGDIKARVLIPESITSDKICVLMHGGGWCIGSTKTYEEVSRRLARVCGTTVVSLEYSLSPEAKFPVAHEECQDATTWLAEHMQRLQNNATALVLVGDSAGGNLVVATTYEVETEVRKKISQLVAIYPVSDSVNDYPSNTAYAKGYYLTSKAMAQFTEAMIADPTHLSDKRLSPIQYDMVPEFPKTIVLTADYDPLRDQAEALAAKIKRDGAHVMLKRYHGTIHAFWGLKDFGSRGVVAIDDIGRFLRGESISDLMPLS